MHPSTSADEATVLSQHLQHLRETLRRQASGLDAEQLGQRLAPSTLTLGGLVNHLCLVEDQWFSYVLAGNDWHPDWRDVDWRATPDHEFDTWSRWSPDELLERHRAVCARSDAHLEEALVRGGLDQLCTRRRHGQDVNVRWILVHMVEEYGRHCGHADLLREAVDGTVGL